MVLPKKTHQGLVLNEDVLLVDLEVTLRFLQVVHLGNQEISGSGAYFEFKLFELGSHFDQRFALRDAFLGLLEHLFKLTDFEQVGGRVSIDIAVA